MKQGFADALLVAGAYPKINGFIMDAQLQAIATFIMKIPPLLLACKFSDESATFGTIFHHPAVEPLAKEMDIQPENIIHASSNSEACRMVINAESPSVCITNALCSEHFKLKTLKILRAGIFMPWVCFEKADALPQNRHLQVKA